MVPREQLLDAILHELAVCKHLVAKVPEGGFDYRPSEKQRTTIELLRYLATCGIGPIESMVAGDWEHYSKREETVKEMTAEEFSEVMEKQGEAIREAFTQISDDDFANKIVQAPGAGKLPLGTAIMRTSYAWLVAYRHELFLRAKASGNAAINTANNWGGIDWKPQNEVEEETEA
ncbi:MAG: DinB family protein [Ignavibacteriae bacterium]|nr:DinB family protein [Ignavibacteriota bacterium]MCB9214742.1 DinB family protein [Ignavibacteria bacterium]